MRSSYLYNPAFKVLFPGLFLVGLIGLFIEPAPEMYPVIAVLGLFSLIILTDRWHRRNHTLTVIAYALLALLPLLRILHYCSIHLF